jgi:hypothetical protein
MYSLPRMEVKSTLIPSIYFATKWKIYAITIVVAFCHFAQKSMRVVVVVVSIGRWQPTSLAHQPSIVCVLNQPVV